MLTRRKFIRTAGLLAFAPYLDVNGEREIWINDIHSQLNRTRIRSLLAPRTQDELAQAMRRASHDGVPISVSGCRHSMGGQQFATDSICIDMRKLADVLAFDRERGLIEAEAGIQWPKLIDALPGCAAGDDASMEHCAKTNRCGYVYAGRQPVLKRAWARSGDEAADFKC